MLESTESDRKSFPHLSIYQQSSFSTLQGWLKLRQIDANVEKDAKEAEIRASGKATPRPQTYHDVMAALKHYEFLKPQGKPVRLFGRRKALTQSQLALLRRQALFHTACERISSPYWFLPAPVASAPWVPEYVQSLYGVSIVPEITFFNNSPHYLWDSHRNEVRTAAEIILTDGPFLRGVPDYVAISHSWVRWQDHTAPPLRLPGVPWDVPQNSKFKVEELPVRLAVLPWRYFWIDLLTIPQGSSLEPDMLAQQDWEVKCVPQTFRKAAKAFAWLDDISSWTSLPAALTYLALEYLSSTPRTGLDKDSLSSSLHMAKTVADNPLELLEHGHNRQTPATDVWKPNAFFTSPWSFQEAIARPDMLVCNGNWEFLRITKDMALALNDMAALLQVFEETHGIGSTLPLSVQELFQLYKRTGLMRLLDITRDTSVKLLEKVDGILPVGARRFPQIVASADGDGFNPHDVPNKYGPRYTHYLTLEDVGSSEL
jgi:hypothetical protein